MSFIRKIKTKSGTYLAEVENYREDGKVKQRFIKYLGVDVGGIPQRAVKTSDISINQVKEYLNFQTIHTISKELGLPEILGEKSKYILLMIYSHLVEKLSVSKMKNWIEKTELPNLLDISELGTNTLYNALDALDELDWDKINNKITNQWFLKYKETKDKAIIIDVTDTYFNGSGFKWKRRKGKDGKYDKLLQIGLAVTGESGFPLKHRIYEGNISNSKIMSDFISDTKIMGMKTVVIDRGMTSIDSLNEFDNLKVECIAGIKSNVKLERDFIDKTPREEIFTKNNIVKLKETIVYAKSYEYKTGKLIVIFNPDIEVNQRNKLFSKETVTDKELTKMKYFGYSFIFHSTDYETTEVVKKYFEKDIVEKSFHQIKGVLSLHPVRLQMLERISAHVKICYLGFCILSLIKFKLKKLNISAIDALEELSTAYKVYLTDDKNNFNWSKVVTLKKPQEKIIKALEIDLGSV
jgi:transposase